jgi:hypothetical protein
MAMNNTQKSLAVKLRQLCKAQLIINNQISSFSAMWSTEDMASLVDADWAALPEFPGVTKLESVAAKNAFDSVKTLLADYAAGTLSRDMLKLCDQVPNGS